MGKAAKNDLPGESLESLLDGESAQNTRPKTLNTGNSKVFLVCARNIPEIYCNDYKRYQIFKTTTRSEIYTRIWKPRLAMGGGGGHLRGLGLRTKVRIANVRMTNVRKQKYVGQKYV